MKGFKILLITILCFSCFFICSCSNKEDNVSVETMEHSVAYELSKIDSDKSLDDETLKSLSIIIRTKFYNESNNNKTPYNDIDNKKKFSTDYINNVNNNTNNNNYNIDNKYLDIVNSTKKQVIKKGEELADVDYQLKNE